MACSFSESPLSDYQAKFVAGFVLRQPIVAAGAAPRLNSSARFCRQSATPAFAAPEFASTLCTIHGPLGSRCAINPSEAFTYFAHAELEADAREIFAIGQRLSA